MSYQGMQHCHQFVGATTTKQVFQNLLMFDLRSIGKKQSCALRDKIPIIIFDASNSADDVNE